MFIPLLAAAAVATTFAALGAMSVKIGVLIVTFLPTRQLLLPRSALEQAVRESLQPLGV